MKPLLIALDRGSVESVILDLTGVEFASPGAMVPLVALATTLRVEGMKIDVEPPRSASAADYFLKAGWTQALSGQEPPQPAYRGATYLPVAHFHDAHSLHMAVSRTVEMVASVAVYPSGIMKAIEWALNELADNVLVRAGPGIEGWTQAISTPKNGRIDLTVADSGRGVLASLRERYPTLRSDREALDYAIQPGITRDTHVGQGNGLSGTVRIAQAMNGWFNLLSGRGELRIMNDGTTYAQETPRFGGTAVDITLPTTAAIDIADALWGHEPLSTLELSRISGEEIIFRVRDETAGFGSRAAGAIAANKLSNLLVEVPSERIALDFEGVDLVSASYIDEFIAKLVRRYGVATFLSRVSLRNMSSLVARTVNAVVAQRMSSPD